MRQFAQGRAKSPQQGRANSSNRRTIAQEIRMPVAHQDLSHSDHAQQQPIGLPQRGGRGSAQGTQRQQQQEQQQQPPRPQDRNVKPEPGKGFDTDAESIDTSVQGRSTALLENDQERERQHAGPYEGDVEDDEDGEEDGDHDEGSDEIREDERDHVQYNDRGDGMTNEELLQQGNLLNTDPELQRSYLVSWGRNVDVEFGVVNGDSYPPTTSGVPSDYHNYEPDEPADSLPTPQPSQLQARPQRQPAEGMQAYSHRPPVPQVLHSSAKPTGDIFQRGAGLRQNERSDPKRAPVTETPHQAYNAPPQVRQPAVNTQVHYDRPMVSTAQANPLPYQGPIAPQRSGRHLPHRVQPTAHPKAHTPATHGHTKTQSRQEFEPTAGITEQDQGPFEDYDHPILFKKNFEQLKKQDFDDNPRASPQILSDDMLRKPLVERLEHVKDRLDPNDQGKFFRSLPTKEWEDAGDWFVEQFTNIITKSKEARQEKRKLAREFEDEVEKRHYRVAKRQKNVDDALKKMKTQGVGLLQSPRRDK
ncbi:hypothetical protein P154DRAFT_538821 [Amniculicola lignicola CBS 123094]|uniref:Extracellular mutant protein 11 C-terminal domain-containing protein n=1 Tax=Amniculicola lignicola CBS 123094 TaxID=1392246 RepID=A0A6A5W5S5_9PLEO|nr:hypothetical protein P154DRAFT_538821 [Amniculicola lignicola CBS 123094]